MGRSYISYFFRLIISERILDRFEPNLLCTRKVVRLRIGLYESCKLGTTGFEIITAVTEDYSPSCEGVYIVKYN
jgi:hypothetical protein